ncbi:hypothetical protein JCM10296v2_003253 [Rhodotorula toruloides]
MPSFAVSPYLAPYAPYLRPTTYYALWTLYYLSFLLSPILITILQMLTLLLPLVERAVETYRRRLEVSEWGREEWAFPEGRGGGGEESEWVKKVKGYVDVKPALENAWAKVVGKLRGLSASMGWNTQVEAGGEGSAAAANPFSMHGGSQVSYRPSQHGSLHSWHGSIHGVQEEYDEQFEGEMDRGSVWSGKEWKKA